MPYVAHLCSSSTLGCRGAERPSAAQRRGAPKRRAAPRGAPRSTVLQRRGAAARRTGALRRNGTQSAQSVASGTGELPIIEPVIESCIRTPGAQPERPIDRVTLSLLRDKNVGPDLRCGAQLPADTGPFSQTALSSTPVARRYLHLCLYVVRVRQ